MASSCSSKENDRPILIPFTYENLQKATHHFDERHYIGGGAHGSVFKALAGDAAGLPSLPNKMVAIKCANDRVLNFQSRAMHSEFEIMRNLSHPNIVHLWGAAKVGNDIYLVYEFMENGTLTEKLAGPIPMSWEQRKGIIIDVARGLMYLHHERERPIIHGDIKSSNVLLDTNLKAKIGDFGTAMEVDGPQPMRPKFMPGTKGYMPRESVMEATISPATDVYLFGIVVLEILTGKSISFEDKNQAIQASHITEWAYRYRHRIAEIMDKKLRGQYIAEEAERILELTLDCVSHARASRPTIKDFLAAIGS